MRRILSIVLLSCTLGVQAGSTPKAPFTENKGQWPAQVAFRTRVPNGSLFVERTGFTYFLQSGGPLAHHHSAGSEHEAPERLHAYRVTFSGAREASPEGQVRQGHYENFFLGNDPSAWGTGCAVYGRVRMNGLYPGIDLEVDGREGLKYSFLVAPGSDPSLIVMHFDGPDRLSIQDGRLVVETSVGTVIEDGLVAYQQTPAGQQEVPCRFQLDDDRVRFILPEGYDAELPLVIDPVLSFATYTGSTASNFGFTATYDNSGHLYGGGIAFGIGYPVTTGVIDPDFNGGNIDISLTKFSTDGSSLIWSTYLGGSGNETPQSLVVNSNDELFLFGSTGSSDFPTTAGAHGTAFNGGTAIPSNGWTGLSGGTGYGFAHAAGTDIVVVHFSSDATSLLGSTYVGGSGNDGLNNTVPTMHNYSDHFRGEIALDQQEWPVVCTSTQSTDIPVSANAPQIALSGPQDAYIFRMDPSLSSIQATYFGGSGTDSGYGVQFDSNGQIFVTGGTTSPDLPTPGAPFMPGHQGGADAFIAKLGPQLEQIHAVTYLGTPQYDQSYFVQVDTEDAVYVVGQTHGDYPISPNVYANPGSALFIHKLSNDLSTSFWSTRFGSGGPQDISPSAFLVSDCGQIYFSGWGGTVNTIAQATISNTYGLPLTPDAFQSTTDGQDFYLMVLDQDAAALNYATYFGGNQSPEHVDGGTSRFDKHGTVYQAVCAGCQGNNDFPTTPGAWSSINGTNYCNLGVFKFDLMQPTAHIAVDGPDYACLPDAHVSFINLSTGGSIFNWDFGDGTSVTAFEPDHSYAQAGQYTVRLILSSNDPCLSNDTAYVDVEILEPPSAQIEPVPPACIGESVQLHAHGGDTYQWLAAPGLTDLGVADPVAQPPGDITYTVLAFNICGVDTATVDIEIYVPEGTGTGGDVHVCTGQSVALEATGGSTYQWSPAGTLDDPASGTPMASPTDTTTYHVLITTPDGCLVDDSVVVFVQHGVPDPIAADTAICLGEQVQLHVSGGDHYSWAPVPGIDSLHVPDPIVAPVVPTQYTVQVSNSCGVVDAGVFVDVQQVVAHAWPDTVVCPNESLVLHAAGGTHYAWSPISSAGAELVLDPAQSGTYSVIVSNDLGCWDAASVTVSLHPPAQVMAGYQATVDQGHSAQLTAIGEGSMVWSPDSTLSCTTCPDPLATPGTTTTYTVALTDVNGCKAMDHVTIFVHGILFVPNTFTPDHDDVNDVFRAKADGVIEYTLMIFNRWGQLIFTSDRLEYGWDGTFRGRPSPIDTYVWRIDYRESNGTAHTAYGHVNLVR